MTFKPIDWEVRVAQYTSPPDANGCMLWTSCRSAPRGYARLFHHGKVATVSRLIWEKANGPIPKGMFVCHKCDTPACVNLDHLFIGTHQDNMADKVAKGRQSTVRGEDVTNSKLTEKDIIAIRSDPRGVRPVSKDFGVSSTMVSRIRQRKAWAHI